MLALEVLDCMVNIDRTGGWLAFLGSQGYLQHLVDSVVQDDHSLIALLTSQDQSLRPLYIFECKLVRVFLHPSTDYHTRNLSQHSLQDAGCEIQVSVGVTEKYILKKRLRILRGRSTAV